MSTQIKVNLPDDTYRRVETYAAYAQRDLSEIVAAVLATALPSLELLDELRAIPKLPDEEVVSLSESRMDSAADHRLSTLLDRQQAAELTETERAELAALMREYEIGLLRQSQALAEAVRRGLRPPLEP